MIKNYNVAAAFFEENTGQRIDPDTDTITIWETTGPATIMTVSRNGAQLRAMYLGFDDPIVLTASTGR